MMCDTNWCTFCDNAISPYSDSLYCSEDCLRQDALMHHPMLGYNYPELQDFPTINRRKSSTLTLSSPKKQTPSQPPSLSSSFSSTTEEDVNRNSIFSTYQQPKPRRAILPLFMNQTTTFIQSS
ncbi:MAG: hypothetical protein EXX96DRAFT_530713 [Benjaminiella poitrasii]|nr:MAG: hypothetical protein EXX96DRAFT_530713 [Benjaminiella poitrasii]